jgi:hypothetical protein
VTVHYVTIASGNQVMRSAAERDRVSTELSGVFCFERGGGPDEQLPVSHHLPHLRLGRLSQGQAVATVCGGDGGGLRKGSAVSDTAR